MTKYGVLFFRDQRITPEQQVTFTRRFGQIEFNIFGERWSVPGRPEIVVVSNITDNGMPIGIRRAGENWHSDMLLPARPPCAGRSSMRSRHQNFTACRLATPNLHSAAAAWDALPESLRRRIEGRRSCL